MTDKDSQLIYEAHWGEGHLGEFKPWDGLQITHSLHYYAISDEQLGWLYPDQYTRDHRLWEMELIWLILSENGNDVKLHHPFEITRHPRDIGKWKSFYPNYQNGYDGSRMKVDLSTNRKGMFKDQPWPSCLHSYETWKKWHSSLPDKPAKGTFNVFTKESIDLNNLQERLPAGTNIATRKNIDVENEIHKKHPAIRVIPNPTPIVEPFPLLIDIPMRAISGIQTDDRGTETERAPSPIMPNYYSRNSSAQVQSGLRRL